VRALASADATSEVQPGEVLLAVTDDELYLIKNALNEVVNGLPIADFPRRFGADWNVAQTLLRAVQSIRARRAAVDGRGQDDDRQSPEPGRSSADGAEAVIAMSNQDLRLIRSALDEVLNEIDANEFQTRLGVEPEEAQVLAERLGTLVEHPASDAKSASPTVPASSAG